MKNTNKKIDEYISKSADFARPVLKHLRELIHKTCPDIQETWKWSFPHFSYKGDILCGMAAFKQHCSFGFWKASLMQDPDNILGSKEIKAMGQFGRLKSISDLPSDKIMIKYLKEAMKLNEEGKKLPARKTTYEKKELIIPDYFTVKLKKNKSALKTFENFSYSHKKEYIQWITEAKTDATRDKRISTAIEWLAEGKSRNWKYQKC